MEPDYILAVDHGTSGMKTALVSVQGEVADFEYQPVKTRFLPGGGAEQDPADWWDALVATTRKLLQKGVVKPDRVAAVCCSSTFSSTVAVGEDGRHLAPSLTWMDSRAATHIKELVGGFPAVEGYGVLKVLRWIRITGGGPQLSGKDDIAHLLYWKNRTPDIYRRARFFMGSKDYLNLRLTGAARAGHDSMTLFWVIDSRDPRKPRYHPGLIRKLGIDGHKLPPLIRAVDVVGTLSKDASRELGLPASVKVVCGSPDHQSACIGSGAVRDFEGHLYVGTSSWAQCIVPFKKTDMFHSIASLLTSIPGKYYAANEQDIAGGALDFLVKNVFFAGNPPPDAHRLALAMAESSPAGSSGVLFTPWLNGERTPVDDNQVRAGFFNLSMSTTQADLARAVLEGVALNTRWALKYVERFIGRRLDPINMVGGGARSDLWCRIFADVTGRVIRKVADPVQTNARGAAFIAAVGLGRIGFEDIPALTRIEQTFEPDPERRRLYDEIFDEFVRVYRRVRPVYCRLNRRPAP